MGDGDASGPLRSLPPVHELAGRLELDGIPHGPAVRAARRAIDERRAVLQDSEPAPDSDLHQRAHELAAAFERPALQRVLNATGVIIHTGLGRAPLAAAARDAVATAAGYTNLELELVEGNRGDRQDHLRGLLRELTGAEDGLVVGNGAGAVLLAVAALAGRGGRVVVSRGQLVEIGGGFRIPEVIAASGAELVEVGTTNRTRLSDYRHALADGRPAVILRVHQSNFRTVGFVAEPAVDELCELGVPVIDDIGSGALLERELPALAGEPGIRAAVGAGSALVCCSADKLLGGPQAGLLVGRSAAVKAAAAHPLARALRIDKLSLAALAATLALLRDPARALREIPVLRMLAAPPELLTARAERLAEQIGDGAEVVGAIGRVGGGALPLLELPGPAVAVAGPDPRALAAALRRGEPPVVGRIEAGRLLLDPRTLADEEVPLVAGAVRAVR